MTDHVLPASRSFETEDGFIENVAPIFDKISSGDVLLLTDVEKDAKFAKEMLRHLDLENSVKLNVYVPQRDELS